MPQSRGPTRARVDGAIGEVQERAMAIKERRLNRPPYRARLLQDLRSAALCIAWALPIAMTGATGIVRAVGFVYAGLWALLLVPSTASYLYILLDAALLLLKRRPLIIPGLMYAHIAGLDVRRPAVSSAFLRLGKWSADANPIGMLTGRMVSEAVAWRVEMIHALAEESLARVAAERSRGGSRADLYGSVVQVQIPQPLLRRMEPELACAAM